MKKNLLRLGRLVTLFLLAGMLSSCFPQMHLATSHNVPMLQEKYEGSASIATGTQAVVLQGAFAASKHIGIMGTYATGIGGRTVDGAGIQVNMGNRRGGELAVGYYNAPTSLFRYEIYGGLERYSMHFYATEEDAYIDNFYTDMLKPFVQLNAGLFDKNRNGVALSLKSGYATFQNFYFNHWGDNYFVNGKPHFDEYILTQNKGGFVLEPALTGWLGLKNARAFLQLGSTIAEKGLKNSFTTHYHDYNVPFFINIGLNINITPSDIKHILHQGQQ